MKKTVYNQKGDKAGDVTLPEAVFDVPWNPDLVHQVVTVMQANARENIAHAQDRSEKRGGGRKPWAQKGTGRARHGSNRSPLWAGGGVTFGPRNERNFSKKINKKMAKKAMVCTLSQKAREGEVVLVDELAFDEAKTKHGKVTLNTLSEIKGVESVLEHSALILVPERNDELDRVFANFGNVTLDEVRNTNALELLQHKYVVIVDPDSSIEVLENRLGRQPAEKKTAATA